MAEFPVVLPPLAVVDGVGRRNKKRAGGLPKLLHKFFFKVLRLRPTSSSSVSEQSAAAAAFEAYYGYRMVDECYYYSYGATSQNKTGRAAERIAGSRPSTGGRFDRELEVAAMKVTLSDALCLLTWI